MPAPIIQKVISSPEVFVERRLGGGRRCLVKEGSQVRPFDFVAEMPEAPRSSGHQHLTAGVGGEVVKILSGQAVLIKTAAVIIRGAAGGGEDSEGEIKIAASHDEPIRLEAIEAGCVHQILVGGFVSTLEVLKKAEALGVSGIVCGGMDFAASEKIGLPILVTEGFGRIPLNRRAFEFLRGVEGRHVFLSPEHRELLVARHLDGEEDRRELIEAQPEEVSEAFAEVKKGMTVQVFAGDVFGQMGKVEKVEGDEVSVVLDTGDKIVVPERNVGIVR